MRSAPLWLIDELLANCVSLRRASEQLKEEPSRNLNLNHVYGVYCCFVTNVSRCALSDLQ